MLRGDTLAPCAPFLDLLAALHAIFGALLGHGLSMLHARVVPLLALVSDRLATLVPALVHIFAMFGAALGHGLPMLHARVVPLLPLLPDRFVTFRVALVRRLTHALAVVLSQSGGQHLHSRRHPRPFHPRCAIPGAVAITVEAAVKEVVSGMIAHDIAVQAAVEGDDHTVMVHAMHMRARVPMVMAMVDAARNEKREDRERQHGNGPLATR